jgi:uncharacterized DUF497 family protein
MVDWNRFVPSDFEYDFENDKLASHHVTINEAIECFYSDHEVRRNKKYRDRYQLVGRTLGGRSLRIIFQLKRKKVVRIITGWPFMTSNKKRTRKHLSGQSIDDIVEEQVTDDSAWEKPIQVSRKRAGSGTVRLKTSRSRGSSARLASVVVLDPDVAGVFVDSESVNQALRALAGIIQHQSEKAHP